MRQELGEGLATASRESLEACLRLLAEQAGVGQLREILRAAGASGVVGGEERAAAQAGRGTRKRRLDAAEGEDIHPELTLADLDPDIRDLQLALVGASSQALIWAQGQTPWRVGWDDTQPAHATLADEAPSPYF